MAEHRAKLAGRDEKTAAQEARRLDTLRAPLIAQDAADVAPLRARIEPNVRASGENEGDDVRWKCQ
jgi:hypothetical protein